MPLCPYCGPINAETDDTCGACSHSLEPEAGGRENTRIAEARPEYFSPGDLIAGRYRVERKLGECGIGAVHHARDIESK